MTVEGERTSDGCEETKHPDSVGDDIGYWNISAYNLRLPKIINLRHPPTP
jgi:hypothetical protein